MTCTCHACIKRNDLRSDGGLPLNLSRMITCPNCGDKRCVHAHDHEAPCAKADLFAHNAWVEKHLYDRESTARAWLSPPPLSSTQPL